jgi:hypothetical protein
MAGLRLKQPVEQTTAPWFPVVRTGVRKSSQCYLRRQISVWTLPLPVLPPTFDEDYLWKQTLPFESRFLINHNVMRCGSHDNGCTQSRLLWLRIYDYPRGSAGNRSNYPSFKLSENQLHTFAWSFNCTCGCSSRHVHMHFMSQVCLYKCSLKTTLQTDLRYSLNCNHSKYRDAVVISFVETIDLYKCYPAFPFLTSFNRSLP